MATKSNRPFESIAGTFFRVCDEKAEAEARRHSSLDDPLNPRVKHIFHHNQKEINSQQTDGLQTKINKAISKIMDMNLLESDRKELIKILAE